jgi:hypothetical protein
MPVTATITIEAEDREQLGEIFSAIGSVLSGARSRAVLLPPSGRTPDDPVVEWYRTHGRDFLARLTDNARSALGIIVSSDDDHVPFATVSDAIGKRGTALAGTLASVGVATKSMSAPEPPFERDAKRKTYRMNAALREVFRELMATPPSAPNKALPSITVAGDTGW